MSSFTTPEIERLASELGASKSSIFKWRKRGIPARWQLKIMEIAGKTFDDARAEVAPSREEERAPQ